MQQHEVNAAADALLAQRLRPTVERVRHHLGRGSPNTIGPMLETWFDTLAGRLGLDPDTADATIPPAVGDAMRKLWSEAVEAARAAADAAVAGERQALQASRVRMDAAQAEFASQQAAAAEREVLLRQARDVAQEQLQAVSDQLRASHVQLQERDRSLREAQDRIAELERQKDVSQREHRAEITAQAQEHARQLDRTAATERRMMGEIDRARQEAKAAQKAAADLQARHAKDRAGLERETASLGEQLQALQVEVTVLRERLAASERHAAELQAVLGATASQASDERLARNIRKPLAGKRLRSPARAAGPKPKR